MSGQRVKVAVLGAGSWGTALAKHMADQGHPVKLWARREEHAAAIQKDRENARYLPGFPLPECLSATSDLGAALTDVEYVISVVPSQSTRDVWKEGAGYLAAGVPILCASKGIENGTHDMMVTVLKEVAPGHPVGFIGGPSFAKEVAAHLPTAIVIGSDDEPMAQTAQDLMSCDWMRAYFTHDVIGVEIGGALKNVIAIACGCADGLELGYNTRSAIITRGLAEITRCAVRLGADPVTLAGLAGMGDLVLTCTGDLSRNRRVGIGLGQGKQLPQILEEMGQVAEGVKTTLSAKELADKVGVEMPITQEVYRILYEDKPVREVVLSLMRRSLKKETH
ncbi:MAG: NAD(P)-dependent glycerol-3-phosphate dehydrogenase [Myxococcales bacterium]|nr:NAD(P)-dependent glycerol-3-phosphate dehydrogenase [Myxococcales bacterium]MCB9647573.1 NAD(P)-dependent glycerol-3-phosphate dehydrogenase [Deltaproteobacteria bacterium]